MRIFVKPAAGKAVRQPMSPFQRVPETGFVQEDSSAWRRLQAAGDVIITAAADGAASSAAATSSGDVDVTTSKAKK